MFDSDGHIVLADFSHADFSHSTESQQSRVSKNYTSTIMPEYRAPEILLGWPRDAAVDCWSFGMLVYFMLFGTVRIFLPPQQWIDWFFLSIRMGRIKENQIVGYMIGSLGRRSRWNHSVLSALQPGT